MFEATSETDAQLHQVPARPSLWPHAPGSLHVPCAPRLRATTHQHLSQVMLEVEEARGQAAGAQIAVDAAVEHSEAAATASAEAVVAATRKLRETVGSLANTLAEIDGAIDGGDVDAIEGRLVQINRHLRAIPDSITSYEGFSGSMPL